MMKTIFILLAMLVLTSCAGPFQIGEGGSEGNNNDHHEPYQSYTLEHHYKRVIRYDCSGRVASDGYETVKTPVTSVAIHPKNNIPIMRSEFRNGRNGDTPSWVQNYKRFNIDFGNGFFNMVVLEGENDIEYSFYNCGIPTLGGGCDRWDLQEEGVVIFNITYNERIIDGINHVKPNQCP